MVEMVSVNKKKSEILHNLVRNDKFNHGFVPCFERSISMPCIFFEKGTPTQNTYLQTKGGRETDVMIASSFVCVYVCLYMLRSRRGFNSSRNLYFASKKRDMIVGKE